MTETMVVPKTHAVLIVDDQAKDLEELERVIGAVEPVGEVHPATSRKQAFTKLQELIEAGTPTVVLLDACLRPNNCEPSLKLLDDLKRVGAVESGLVEVIVTSSLAQAQDIRKFRDLGFWTFIDKPGIVSGARTGIELHIQDAVARMDERAARRHGAVQHGRPAEQIIADLDLPPEWVPSGNCSELWKTYDHARVRARSGVNKRVRPIFIVYGETGTGKRGMAMAVHRWAGRGNYRSMNVKSLTGKDSIQLPRGGLFGYDKSFRHKNQDEPGPLDEVGDGTVVLDDLQHIDADTCEWLLQFLDERVYTRVGGGPSIEFKGQLVITINVPLDELYRSGKLDVQTVGRIKAKGGEVIELPTLAERGKDDVVAWFGRYIQELFREEHQLQARMSQEAEQEIRDIPLDNWGDNIRGVEGLARAVVNQFKIPGVPPPEHVVSGDEVRSLLRKWVFITSKQTQPQQAVANPWAGLNLSQAEGAVFQKYLNKWEAAEFQEAVRLAHREAWLKTEERRLTSEEKRTGKRGESRNYREFVFNLSTRNEYLATVEALIKSRGSVTTAAEKHFGKQRSNFHRNINLYGLRKRDDFEFLPQ